MDERELFDMVNSHSDEARRQEQERQTFNMVNENSNSAKRVFANANQMSKSKNKIGYGKRKKKNNKNRIKVSITAIVLAATLVASSLGVGAIINNAKVAQDVNQRITEYSQMMDYQSGPNNAIETVLENRIIDTDVTNPRNEAAVDYTNQNIENLSRHLIEASKISETDARCAIIAAYNIINSTYEDDIIGKALEKASLQQDETAIFSLPSNTDELLDKLGYENWEEYHKNERKNIYELKEMELKREKEMGGKQL